MRTGKIGVSLSISAETVPFWKSLSEGERCCHSLAVVTVFPLCSLLWGLVPLIQDSSDLIKNQGLCSYSLQGLLPKQTLLGFLYGLTVSFAFGFALH